jgi:Branched-chain amino acid ATP-binding cassette transporter
MGDRIAVLDFGQLIALGESAQVKTNPAVIAAYLGNKEILLAAFARGLFDIDCLDGACRRINTLAVQSTQQFRLAAFVSEVPKRQQRIVPRCPPISEPEPQVYSPK